MREKNQKTQADIIAEMRMGNPVGPCAYRIGLPDKEEVYESGAKRRITMIKNVTVQELADRLEAAAKREKAQPGNAAAMREALMQVSLSCSACPRHNCKRCTRPFASFMPAVRKALSVPARNCDKMPDIDNLTMHDLANSPCKSTLANASREELLALVRWLLAPAAERKGEGDA